MNIRIFKYTSPLLLFAAAMYSFLTTGINVWIPMFYAWVYIPLIELFLKPNPRNLPAAEEELARKNRFYDFILYTIVPLQFVSLYLFLNGLSHDKLSLPDLVGRIWAMGLLCGIFGINVGHELGHRVNRFEQTLAQSLLLTSLYMHFFIEHNKGHHKRVATPDDPSSARYGEPVYLFYFRTIVFSYLSAWHIANTDTRKAGHAAVSVYNPMLLYHFIQIGFVLAIGLVFGWFAMLCFLVSAGIGILLLETVNYIEHYGLSRKKSANGQYERAMPEHSWNSDHIVGRLMLFELSRHSDHHYLASRKYQILRHHDESPQMPTGYPGMMLLSLVPPAWFYVMHKAIRKRKGVSVGSNL